MNKIILELRYTVNRKRPVQYLRERTPAFCRIDLISYSGGPRYSMQIGGNVTAHLEYAHVLSILRNLHLHVPQYHMLLLRSTRTRRHDAALQKAPYL